MSSLQLAQISPAPIRPTDGGLAPGLHVHVLDGIIQLSNGGGSTSFSAGQFGYTASFNQRPVMAPNNPALKFTPPPTFNSTAITQGAAGGAKSNAVDCEVR